MVESRHRADVAIVDADGKVVARWGDIEPPIYGRSAIKPLQALPLIESGAADAFGARAMAEIALACASHSGEPRHVERVARLARAHRLHAPPISNAAPQLPYRRSRRASA